MTSLPRFVTIEKAVGETPLAAMEAWRQRMPAQYAKVPLAYAGRLDPLASGRLLVLIGDECKQQTSYHRLDKRYEFSILLGVGSDTHDVLGRLMYHDPTPTIDRSRITATLRHYQGQVALPYPAFSAKTVRGKALHTWTLEGRLHEITIPTQTSTVYSLQLQHIETKDRRTIYTEALTKINSIPTVTAVSKALGQDFRRDDIRADWATWRAVGSLDDTFTIIHLACIASSGTYMRSLATAIGTTLGTHALAYHIHRTHIGRYQALPFRTGFWWQQYR